MMKRSQQSKYLYLWGKTALYGYAELPNSESWLSEQFFGIATLEEDKVSLDYYFHFASHT